MTNEKILISISLLYCVVFLILLIRNFIRNKRKDKAFNNYYYKFFLDRCINASTEEEINSLMYQIVLWINNNSISYSKSTQNKINFLNKMLVKKREFYVKAKL